MTDQKPNLLYGAEAIANYLGIGQRQAYFLHESKAIPTFKVGAKVCARRSDLDAWLEAAASGAGR